MSARTGFRIARTSEVFNSDDNLPGGGRGGSIAEIQKRGRGRPATGTDPVRTVRWSDELDAAISAWIAHQPEPKPSRSEAIRQLIEKGLRSG